MCRSRGRRHRLVGVHGVRASPLASAKVGNRLACSSVDHGLLPRQGIRSSLLTGHSPRRGGGHVPLSIGVCWVLASTAGRGWGRFGQERRRRCCFGALWGRLLVATTTTALERSGCACRRRRRSLLTATTVSTVWLRRVDCLFLVLLLARNMAILLASGVSGRCRRRGIVRKRSAKSDEARGWSGGRIFYEVSREFLSSLGLLLLLLSLRKALLGVKT